MMKALLMTALILFAGIAQAKEEKSCPFRANNGLFDKTTVAAAKANSAAPKGAKARGIRE